MAFWTRIAPVRAAQLLGRPAVAARAAVSVRPSSPATPGVLHRAAAASPALGQRRGFAAAPKTVPSIPEFDVKDKVILITGGARGLGLTQTQALLEVGAKVHTIDIASTPSEPFQALQASYGDSLFYHNLDVCSEKLLNSTARAIADQHGGRLDGAIANAGILEEMGALDYSAADFRRILEVNVTGCFLTAQAAARQMIRLGRGGSIVTIASMSATIANRGMPMTAYNASKGAVLQMTRNLASEWGPYNIRVNSLSPGYIVTQMVQKMFDNIPERQQVYADQNMLGRLSRPEEYRGVAIFLLSDASSYMTGADLIIDGGHHSW